MHTELFDAINKGAHRHAQEADRDAAIAAIKTCFEAGGNIVHDWVSDYTIIDIPQEHLAAMIDLDFLAIYGVPLYSSINATTRTIDEGQVIYDINNPESVRRMHYSTNVLRGNK